jgi:hypothetical protein
MKLTTLSVPLSYSCLKLYCQCFASSTTCGPKCKCQACRNTSAHGEFIEDARKTILERNPCAFDDKFRGAMTPNPNVVVRHSYATKSMSHSAPNLTTGESSCSTLTLQSRSPPASAKTLAPAVAWSSAPPSKSSPSRINKYGCKCRRSFCLKKVRC